MLNTKKRKFTYIKQKWWCKSKNRKKDKWKGKRIEQVKKLKYLGYFSNSSIINKDLKKKIAKKAGNVLS